MYYTTVILLCTLLFIPSVKVDIDIEKLNSGANHDPVPQKAPTRFKTAFRVLESTETELKQDTKQLSNDIPLEEESSHCSNWRRRYYDVKPMDCGDIYKDGFRKSGIYPIWPQSRTSKDPLFVYCDMNDGGGWTVIQRRGDFGNQLFYFFLGWDAYKNGFGQLLREFWIGNDNLFALTNQRSYQLKVDLTDWDKNSKYATYQEFWVDDEIHNYTLHINGYNGTAGDSMKRQNVSAFSTKDKDNDNHPDESCAQTFFGAWWYNGCMDSNLNGLYLGTALQVYGKGVMWSTFNGFSYSHKDVVMKIRATDC